MNKNQFFICKYENAVFYYDNGTIIWDFTDGIERDLQYQKDFSAKARYAFNEGFFDEHLEKLIQHDSEDGMPEIRFKRVRIKYV
jgi:hypothetical protein